MVAGCVQLSCFEFIVGLGADFSVFHYWKDDVFLEFISSLIFWSVWPMVEQGFSGQYGGWLSLYRCCICSCRECLPEFQAVKREEQRELGDSVDGTWREWDSSVLTWPTWASGQCCILYVSIGFPLKLEATTQTWVGKCIVNSAWWLLKEWRRSTGEANVDFR